MREIVTEKKLREMQPKMRAADVAEPTPQVPDEYLSKVLKLIPAEVVSLYIALAGIIVVGGQAVNGEALFWFIFVVCLIGTPLYLMKITKVGDLLQLGISTIAFVVWVFALGGPFATVSWYQPIYGALLLPIFTFFVPMILPK